VDVSLLGEPRQSTRERLVERGGCRRELAAFVHADDRTIGFLASGSSSHDETAHRWSSKGNFLSRDDLIPRRPDRPLNW